MTDANAFSRTSQTRVSFRKLARDVLQDALRPPLKFVGDGRNPCDHGSPVHLLRRPIPQDGMSPSIILKG